LDFRIGVAGPPQGVYWLLHPPYGILTSALN
jgi:hypothetical protein